jgi:transcription-repair coupling factor (superfamily II helicase)
MADLKGEVRVKPLEPEVNVNLSAFFPDDYIPDIDQRLGAYRRLARMTSLKEISAFKLELEDRFGPLPEPAENLLLKIMLKVLCRRADVKRLDLAGVSLALAFSPDHLEDPEPALKFALSDPQRCNFSEKYLLKVRLSAGSDRGLLAQIKNILNKIGCHGNGL